MSGFSLTPEQQTAVEARGGPLLVSAAAGSGTTRVLVSRLTAYLTDPQTPCDIDEFLVITYTKAAAAELRGRIRRELLDRIRQDPRDRRLRRQLTRLSMAHIQTIHSFCKELIDAQGASLGVSPGARLIEEAERDLLYARVLEETLEARYAAMEGSDDPFMRLFEVTGDMRGDRALTALILSAYESVRAHPFYETWMETHLGSFLGAPSPLWEETLLASARRTAHGGVAALTGALSDMAGIPAVESAYGPAFLEDLRQAEGLLAALERGWDEACAVAEAIAPQKLSAARGFEDKEFLADLQERRKVWKKQADALRALLSGTKEEHTESLRAVSPMVQGLFEAVGLFDAALEREKRRLGLLDFSDLEHLAVRLLYTPDGVKTPVSAETAGRFREVLVDEYQDVSRLQELLLQAISRDGQNLFMVGDVRQSIYRFRLAEPGIFLDKYRRFSDAPAPGEPRRVLLSANFRSRPEVLAAVNGVFASIMSTETGEMDYTEREYLQAGVPLPEGASPVKPELLLLSGVPEAAEEDAPAPSRGEAEAAMVAARLRTLLDEGFSVSDGKGGVRPVTPGDMAVLLRSPASKEAVYQEALERVGIPCHVEREQAFFTLPEVRAVLGLLAAADNPRQDVALLAALRCPAYAFDAEALAALREACPDGDLYTAVETRAAAGDPRCARFLRDLAEFRLWAPDLGVSGLLSMIYDRTNLPALYGALPGGLVRQENLTALLTLADRFESARGRGLFAFLRLTDTMCARGESRAKKPASGTARVMSIHKSKGLEFPVVVVADCAKNFNREDTRGALLLHPSLGVGPLRREPERHIEYPTLAHRAIAVRLSEEMLAEEMRVLYVAMTRAREKLILTAAPRDAEKALARRESAPLSPARAAEAKHFADWILMHLASSPAARALWEVKGLTPEETPAVSKTAAPSSEPLPPPDREKIAEIVRRLSFVYPHPADLPSKLTATQLKGRFLDHEAQEDAPPERHAPVFDRPRFMQETGLTSAERGTSLHLCMQYIDFARCADVAGVRDELNRLQQKSLLTKEQAEVIQPQRIAGFFASGLGRRVLAAGAVTREFKFSLLRPAEELLGYGGEEEILLQGMVDLYFEEPGGLVLVDFKTDRILPGGEAARAAHYETQVKTYAAALSRITGQPVAERHLYFFETGTAHQM